MFVLLVNADLAQTTAILLGICIPLVVLVLALTIAYVAFMQRRISDEKVEIYKTLLMLKI